MLRLRSMHLIMLINNGVNLKDCCFIQTKAASTQACDSVSVCGVITLLGLFTGARIEELCQLRGQDIKAEGVSITLIFTGKVIYTIELRRLARFAVYQYTQLL